MGLQCSIIITYATSTYREAEQIAAFPDLSDLTSSVSAAGNRNWGPNDSVFHAISMKSWDVGDCESFFAFLRQDVKWDMPYTVQLFWQPASERHYTHFRYEPLFPEIFRESNS